jgi:hypothetical protein
MKSNLPGVDNDKVKESEPLKRKENSSGEPTIPVHVPLAIFRWLLYTLFFALFLIPFWLENWRVVFIAPCIGHFASQLNAIINKK